MKKVALIVHQDTVFPDGMDIQMKDGSIIGTLDNSVGVFITMRLAEFIKKYNIPVYYTNDEEVNLGGAKELAATWDTDILPIIVDVANVTENVDASLENVYGVTNEELDDVCDFVECHLGLKMGKKRYTGKSGDEDDSWAFVEENIDVMSFTIPVVGDYHTKYAGIPVDGLSRATEALRWVLAYYIGS